MKKLILLFLILVTICLAGCNNANTGATVDTPSGEKIKGNYLGYWDHTEYPDAYSLIVYEQDKDSIDFVLFADRIGANGMVAQMASLRQENVTFHSGVANFKFRDNFGNVGMCKLQMEPEKLTFSFSLDGDVAGNWSVVYAEGSYQKTKELSEIDWFNKDDYELADFNEQADFKNWGLDKEKTVEGKNHMWYGKYYLAGNDLAHDRTTYYSIAADGSATECRYGSVSYGNYYMYESDKPEYDFRILMKFENGNEFLLYGKSNIPKSDTRRNKQDDITFYMYYTNGKMEFYGRYINETYIGTEAAYRAANN